MNEITAEAAVDINAPRSDVWRSLTDPERIQEYYLGAEVQTDWQVGSPITFKGEWDGKSYEDKGEILEAEPERKLTYSHWSPTGGKPDAPAKRLLSASHRARTDDAGHTKGLLDSHEHRLCDQVLQMETGRRRAALAADRPA